MPKLVALQCDTHALRGMLAETRGSKVAVRGMETRMAVKDDSAATTGWLDPAVWRDVVASLRAAGKVGLLVLRRADVELVTLRLPPATDAELAAMVPHQALRQLSSMNEGAVVDFLPLDDDVTQPRTVLVAAVSAERLRQWRQLLKQAGVKPVQIGLRNLHVWRLVCRRCRPESSSYVVVHPVADDVDLTVVVEQRPVLLRSLRLPAALDAAATHDRIVAELRRSLLAGMPEQQGSIHIDRVYLVGDPQRLSPLADRVQVELQMDAQICDPWQSVEGQVAAAEDQAAFSALLAAAEEHAAGEPAGLDLLHPRRPPRQLDRRRLGLLAAAIMLLLVAGGWYVVAGKLGDVDATIELLDQRRRDLEQTLKKSEKQQQLMSELSAWEAAGIHWLDELRDLSLRLPDQRELILQRLNLAPARGRGGAVDMQGHVRDPATVVELEQSLRDPFHEVRSKKVQQRPGDQAFTWYFETAIAIRPRTAEQYRQSQPATAQVSADAGPPPDGASNQGAAQQ